MSTVEATRAQRGATLIELVVSMVVISLAVGGVLLAVERAARSSGDPLVLNQAVAIGEAYLEEILPKNFIDPDQPETGGAEAGETRPTYDDVSDYNGLTDAGARDQANNPIAGLAQYTVSVTVANTALAGIGAADAKRIDVRVTAPFGVDVTMTGYRTNF